MTVQNYIGQTQGGLTLSEVYSTIEDMMRDIFTYDPDEPEASPSVYYSKTQIDTLLSKYYTGTTTDAHINNAIKGIKIPSLEGYATEDYVNDAIAAIDIPEGQEVDLEGYATKSYVDNAVAGITIPEGQEVNLSGYLKKEDVELIDSRSDVTFTQNGNNLSITPPMGHSKVYVEYVVNNTLSRDYIDVTRVTVSGSDAATIHNVSFSKDIATVLIGSVVPIQLEFKVTVSNVKCYQMSTETSETKMTYSPKYIDTRFAEYLTSTETDAHITTAINGIQIPEQQQVDLSGYYSKTDIDNKIAAIKSPSISALNPLSPAYIPPNGYDYGYRFDPRKIAGTYEWCFEYDIAGNHYSKYVKWKLDGDTFTIEESTFDDQVDYASFVLVSLVPLSMDVRFTSETIFNQVQNFKAYALDVTNNGVVYNKTYIDSNIYTKSEIDELISNPTTAASVETREITYTPTQNYNDATWTLTFLLPHNATSVLTWNLSVSVYNSNGIGDHQVSETFTITWDANGNYTQTPASSDYFNISQPDAQHLQATKKNSAHSNYGSSASYTQTVSLLIT